MTRQRASQVARQIVEQGGVVVTGVASSAGSADVAKQVQGLAEDLLATARTNRDLLIGLIRTEVERTVNRLGLVGADELNAMARVVERLQNQLDAAIAFGGRATTRQRRGRGAGDAGSAARRPVRRAPVTFAGAPAAEPSKAAGQEGHRQEGGDEDRQEVCDQEGGEEGRAAKKIAAKKTATAATAPAPPVAPASSAPPRPAAPPSSADAHGAVRTPADQGDQA